MRRVVLAILIWVVFIGGFSLYMRRRRVGATPAEGPTAPPAAGSFTIAVTPDFTATPDPFALWGEDGTGAAALAVRLNGKDVLRLAERVEAGKPVRVRDVAGVVVGPNEVYVEASPPVGDSARAATVRVEVLREGKPMAETTLRGEGSSAVAGSLRFDVKPEAGEVGHGR